jgi:hypothetical protein
MNQRYHESEWRDAIVSNIGTSYATGSRRADRPGAAVKAAKRRAFLDGLKLYACMLVITGCLFAIAAGLLP